MTRDRTGLASIGRTSEDKVTSYVRISCALNLQKISEGMATTWTFSNAMDMSIHMSTSYMDIHIRRFTCGAVHNFRLVGIPMLSHHTAGEETFLHAAKSSDVICPRIREGKLLVNL